MMMPPPTGHGASSSSSQRGVQIKCAFRVERKSGDKGLENFLLGLEMCQGEYIATLDGDDYWTDFSKLQRQVDFLEARPGYSMCFHNCKIEYEAADHESWETNCFLPGESVTTENLLKDAMGQMSTIMIRREVRANRKRTRIAERLVAERLVHRTHGFPTGARGIHRPRDERLSAACEQRVLVIEPRASQWAAFVYGYERVQNVLGEKYHDSIERAICERSYLAAMEYEKERDFGNAGKFLSLALKGQPAWLEPYCAGYGLTGEELFPMLARRSRLYRTPLLFRLWSRFEQLWSKARWRWLVAELGISVPSRLGVNKLWAFSSHLRIPPSLL